MSYKTPHQSTSQISTAAETASLTHRRTCVWSARPHPGTRQRRQNDAIDLQLNINFSRQMTHDDDELAAKNVSTWVGVNNASDHPRLTGMPYGTRRNIVTLTLVR